MIKKVIAYIIIVVCIILAADFIAYKIICNETLKYFNKDMKKAIKLPSWNEYRLRAYDDTSFKWMQENIDKGILRPVSGENFKKPAIWLFGCSFAYGNSMVTGIHNNEDTFGYILSEYTQRPVYNRAYPGWGVQQMLWQLEQEKTYKELPEPEYIVFVFIADHARRLQKIVYDAWSDGAYLRYKINKNGQLEQVKGVLEPLWKLYFVKLWLTHLEFNIRLAEKEHDKNFDLLEKMFIQSKKLAEQKYPNVKFVILKYNGNDGFDRWFVETERWNELEQKGFIVINADKLIGKDLHSSEYLDSDNYHPSKKSWVEISKKLSKKIINDK